ncbi:hypothetical protein ACFYRC_06285 [Streptomyces sp. NPDC005279]|uniref:hypothetical protein n=1 Tax=Streptomyces sp. NPDC005279 TaxID=3364712 RepID=UPI0036CD5AC7
MNRSVPDGAHRPHACRHPARALGPTGPLPGVPLYGLTAATGLGMPQDSAQERHELLKALLARDEGAVRAVVTPYLAHVRAVVTRHLAHVRDLWAK